MRKKKRCGGPGFEMLKSGLTEEMSGCARVFFITTGIFATILVDPVLYVTGKLGCEGRKEDDESYTDTYP